MSDSPFKFLRAGPPPPKVSLLPDALFFTRTIPIAADTPAAEVAAQVELALESLAPFPVAQLYHGYYFPPGASAALVFAAYRRRFTAEQITEAVAEAGLDIMAMHAVRVFVDLVPSSMVDLEPGAAQALVELERAVATRPEYLPLGTQIHTLAARPARPAR
jgi:hypothetical protein